MPRQVTAFSNSTVKRLRSLRDKKHRRSEGLFLAEGLRILTEAGLLEREKRGVWAYYRLVPTAIATIADLLTPPRKRATKKAR